MAFAGQPGAGQGVPVRRRRCGAAPRHAGQVPRAVEDRDRAVGQGERQGDLARRPRAQQLGPVPLRRQKRCLGVRGEVEGAEDGGEYGLCLAFRGGLSRGVARPCYRISAMDRHPSLSPPRHARPASRRARQRPRHAHHAAPRRAPIHRLLRPPHQPVPTEPRPLPARILLHLLDLPRVRRNLRDPRRVQGGEEGVGDPPRAEAVRRAEEVQRAGKRARAEAEVGGGCFAVRVGLFGGGKAAGCGEGGGGVQGVEEDGAHGRAGADDGKGAALEGRVAGEQAAEEGGGAEGASARGAEEAQEEERFDREELGKEEHLHQGRRVARVREEHGFPCIQEGRGVALGKGDADLVGQHRGGDLGDRGHDDADVPARREVVQRCIAAHAEQVVPRVVGELDDVQRRGAAEGQVGHVPGEPCGAGGEIVLVGGGEGDARLVAVAELAEDGEPGLGVGVVEGVLGCRHGFVGVGGEVAAKSLPCRIVRCAQVEAAHDDAGTEHVLPVDPFARGYGGLKGKAQEELLRRNRGELQQGQGLSWQPSDRQQLAHEGGGQNGLEVPLRRDGSQQVPRAEAAPPRHGEPLAVGQVRHMADAGSGDGVEQSEWPAPGEALAGAALDCPFERAAVDEGEYAVRVRPEAAHGDEEEVLRSGCARAEVGERQGGAQGRGRGGGHDDAGERDPAVEQPVERRLGQALPAEHALRRRPRGGRRRPHDRPSLRGGRVRLAVEVQRHARVLALGGIRVIAAVVVAVRGALLPAPLGLRREELPRRRGLVGGGARPLPHHAAHRCVKDGVRQ